MVLQSEASWERPYGWDRWDCKKCDISKSKISQVVASTPFEFPEAVKRFILSISAVYLPQKEMIQESDDVKEGPSIKETLSIHKNLLENRIRK